MGVWSINQKYSRCIVLSVVAKWQNGKINQIHSLQEYMYFIHRFRFRLLDLKIFLHFTSNLNQGQDHWNLRSKNGSILRISNKCFILTRCQSPFGHHPKRLFLKEVTIPTKIGGKVMGKKSFYCKPLLTL